MLESVLHATKEEENWEYSFIFVKNMTSLDRYRKMILSTRSFAESLDWTDWLFVGSGLNFPNIGIKHLMA
jgi:hypothetical protein